METKRFQWLSQYGPIALIGAVVLALTRSYYLGDTTGYAHQILDALIHPWDAGSTFWDAGHLLWRPIGWLLYQAFGSMFPAGQLTLLKIAECLIGFSFLCAWITALLFYSIALRLGVSRWVAVGLATALLCFNEVLNYGHAGHSYVPGLMCLTIAVRLLLSAKTASAISPVSSAGWAGAALAASALLWLPYVLCFPAVILLAACWDGDDLAWPKLDRLGFAVRVCSWTVVVLSAAFLVAIAFDRLYSPAAFLAWLRSASHGRVPAPNLFRTLLGLGRSIVYMEDGIQFKRFLLHDPYAGVTIWSLIGTSLSKLAVVYVLLLGAAVGLARTRRGRVVFAVVFAAVVPNLLAANFLFESGDTERYMFLLPFACVSFALILAGPGTTRLQAGMLGVLLLAVTAWNLSAMSIPAIHSKEETLAQRARLLKPYWRPFSVVGLLNYQDGLCTFVETFPFNPLNRDPLRLFDIIEPSTTRVATWRQEFATRTLAAWAQSGDVWLSKRVLAQTPKPEWAWAEGLAVSVPWKDFPAFFSRLETVNQIGDEDGFVLLAPSQVNRDMLWGVGILPSHPAARLLLSASRP
ncbi:MAG: hypothetical protein ABI822_10525 [Bryobacteraceae bacterium]